MGKLFKKVNLEAVDVYYFGDEPEEGQEDHRDWIKLRGSVSKAEANAILANAPTADRDIMGGLAFLERFFEKVAVSWSLTDTDEHGNEIPLPPTIENYREMDAAGAQVIQDKLSDHFNKLLGREVETAEGESKR